MPKRLLEICGSCGERMRRMLIWGYALLLIAGVFAGGFGAGALTVNVLNEKRYASQSADFRLALDAMSGKVGQASQANLQTAESLAITAGAVKEVAETVHGAASAVDTAATTAGRAASTARSASSTAKKAASTAQSAADTLQDVLSPTPAPERDTSWLGGP